MKPKAKVSEATEAGNVMPADKTQTAPKDKYADVTLLGFSLNRFSPDVRFLIVAGSLLFFHLAYGYVQELIFKARKYPYPLFSTVLQFLIYTLLAVFERANSGEQVTLRRGARMGHFTLAMAYVVGRGMGTEAIKYLDYTTKVLFQSSQLIPVIVIGMLLLGKRFSLVQYLATTFLIGGLFLFSNADAMSSPTFHFKGLLSLFFYVLLHSALLSSLSLSLFLSCCF
ncbi:Adenosine 3'-phospho 5'-phosphosulfate transporter 2, variant 2 [Balamuthia mandrillaris]